MATQLDELSVKFTADIAGIKASLERVEIATLKMAATTERATAKMSSAFNAVSKAITIGLLVAAGKAFLDMTRRVKDAADNLQDTAVRAGVTADELQTLRFAADQTGGSVEGLDKALIKFNKSVGEARAGSEQASKIFKALGLDELIRKGADTGRVFLAYADALKQIKDPAIAAAIAAKLTGKTGDELNAVLSEGSAGLAAYGRELDKVGGRLSNETVKALADSADEAKKLNAVFAKLEADTTIVFLRIVAGLNQMVIDIAAGVSKMFAALDKATGLSKLDELAGGTGPSSEQRNARAKRGVRGSNLGLSLPKPKLGDLSNLLNNNGKAAADEAAKAAEKYRKVVEDLTFDIEQLARSEQEAAFQEELRNRLSAAGVTLDSDRGKAIEELTAQLVSQRQAQEELNAAWEVEAANANRALREMREAQEEWQATMKDAGDAVAQAFEDALIHGEDLQEVFARLLEQLAEMIFQKLVFDQISNAVSSGLSAVGGFAAGGTLNPGNAYQVHRNEVIVPQVPMSVIPARSVGGGGGFSYAPQFNIAPGVSKAELLIALREHDKHVTAKILPMVRNANARGGLKLS